MSGKLSERFQELKTSAGNTGRIKNNNRQKRETNQQQQRGAKFNQQRGVTASNASNNSQTSTVRRRRPASGSVKTDASPQGGKVRINRGRRNSGSQNQNANNRRRTAGRKLGTGKSAANSSKKQPVTAEDLNKDLDTYFFAGGKGPNPEVVHLDHDLDEYMKTKKSDQPDGEATA